MVIVENYPVAVIMCFITMLCWGSWANTQKLATKEWRFQLYYWDYSIGVLILALIFAITLGSFGSSGRSFFDDMAQAQYGALWSAIIGGVVFTYLLIFYFSTLQIALVLSILNALSSFLICKKEKIILRTLSAFAFVAILGTLFFSADRINNFSIRQ